jgi:superoxide dismutase, Cu-Zn family
MRSILPSLALISVLLIGCADTAERDDLVADDTVATPAAQAARVASATLEPTAGNETRGTVTFTEEEGGIRVVANIENLPGQGRYGFHVHEHGDCSAPDAESAGGHFNPDQTEHGAPDAPVAERHAGDLGNLEAGEDGRATYDRLDRVMTLDGEDSIVGRAVIVHASADDLETQPTGDAGPRLACGVIEMTEPAAGDAPQGAFQDDTQD